MCGIISVRAAYGSLCYTRALQPDALEWNLGIYFCSIMLT